MEKIAAELGEGLRWNYTNRDMTNAFKPNRGATHLTAYASLTRADSGLGKWVKIQNGKYEWWT